MGIAVLPAIPMAFKRTFTCIPTLFDVLIGNLRSPTFFYLLQWTNTSYFPIFTGCQRGAGQGRRLEKLLNVVLFSGSPSAVDVTSPSGWRGGLL
jgi:hypothetical protein